MKQIEFFEQKIGNGANGCKLVIFRGDPTTELSQEIFNEAINEYVGIEPCIQFTDINDDNKWIKVLVSGINNLRFKEYINQKL